MSAITEGKWSIPAIAVTLTTAALIALGILVNPSPASARVAPAGAIAKAPSGNPLKLVQQAAAEQAKAKKRVTRGPVFEFQTGLAYVGDTAYRTKYKVRIQFDDGDDAFNGGGGVRALLTATDLLTGFERPILSRRATVFLGLASGGGKLYGIAYRIESIRKEKLRMQLIDFSDPSGKPREVFSEPVDMNSTECLPARLVGVSETGEPLLVRPILGAGCTYDYEYGGNSTDTARLVAVDTNGSQREIVAPVNITAPIEMRNNQLLYSRGDRVIVRDLVTGLESERWNGHFGSVALDDNANVVAAYFANAEQLYRDGYSGSASAAQSQDESRGPALGLISLPADQSQAKSIATESKTDLSAAIRCGSGWVRFVASTKRNVYTLALPNEVTLFSELLDDPSGAWRAWSLQGAIGIELLSDNGEYIRTLSVIRSGGMYAPRCVNGKVIVAYEPRASRPSLSTRTVFGVFDAN